MTTGSRKKVAAARLGAGHEALSADLSALFPAGALTVVGDIGFGVGTWRAGMLIGARPRPAARGVGWQPSS